MTAHTDKLLAPNQKEANDLIKARDLFDFSPLPSEMTKVVVISGPEGTGKTHLACTIAEHVPVYHLDTELRAALVIKKLTPEYKHPIHWRLIRDYAELLVAVSALTSTKKFPPGAVVLDSGSDLRQFAETEYCRRNNTTSVGMPYNWGEINAICDVLIQKLKHSPHMLILTARTTDEYVAGESTGRKVPKIYGGIPYKADLMLQASKLNEKLVVTKPQTMNGAPITVGRDLTLGAIIQSVFSSK